MTFRNPYSLPFLSRFAPDHLVLAAPGAPASSEHSRRISTNAFPGWLSKPALPAIGRTLRHGGRGLAGFVRDSGVPQHWRFLLLMTLLSFATAWMGTRAVMVGVESTWTEIALTAERNENQQLRTRQETLREETEATVADLAATASPSAVTPARYP